MEMSKKKDLLKKMKMPEKKKDPMLSVSEDELSLEGPEGLGDDEMAMEDSKIQSEETPTVSPEITDAEDDVLIQEMEKRGFTVEKAEEEMAEGEIEPSDEEPIA